MLDKYGRTIDYVRLSVTDRCNLRCTYCMPADEAESLPDSDALSYDEMLAVCRVLSGMGVSKVKVTGGEPLLRAGVVGFIGELTRLAGIENVTLTTNGTRLADLAQPLKQAGLACVNISLDTLDEEMYRKITCGGELRQVLRGIDAALASGLAVKVNCVPLRGVNDRALVPVAELAKDRKIAVRFIEMMPIGPGAGLLPVGIGEVTESLERQLGKLEPCGEIWGNGPAVYYRIAGFQGRIGLIGALGQCFCSSCNRLRLTSDGIVRPCLGYDTGVDIKPHLGSHGRLRAAIETAVEQKPACHNFLYGTALPPGSRAMSRIGG